MNSAKEAIEILHKYIIKHLGHGVNEDVLVTDERGNIFVLRSQGVREELEYNPELASLVDVMNYFMFGKSLKKL